MSDEYLWEKKGEPDPEVERLEKALSSLRYERDAPELPRRRNTFRLFALAAAAIVVAALGVALYVENAAKDAPPPDGSGWRFVTASGEVGRLGVGDWIETGAAEVVVLDVAEIGHMDVRPNSRLQLLATGANQHRLHLRRGEVHAVVNAPPRLFVMETPTFEAIDLGCEYTLEVDAAGNGRLEVTRGYVELERKKGRVVKVPYGAVCSVDKLRGPGTPHFVGAPATLRRALGVLDASPTHTGALKDVLASARKRDTLTLWHLLAVTKGKDRERVYDRMAALAAAPSGVTRAATLRLDEVAIAEWWEELRWTW